MNKPYITFPILIIEIISAIFYLMGLVVSCITSPTLIIFMCCMLFCGVMCSLLLHFLPASSWNMPVKLTPQNEIPVFKITALMMALVNLEFALFSFVFTLVGTRNETLAMVSASVLVGGMTLTMAICIVLIIKIGKRYQ